MGFNVRMLCDSVSLDGARLTTMEVTMPRLVLSEFNTHRMLSRNSASSRAIPVEKRIAMVEADPFVPEAFGRNKKGMQANENLDGEEAHDARFAWLSARDEAVRWARRLAQIGVHKQLANRLIEPFCWQTIIVSATEWDNFFALRCHPDAQPEIRKAAEMMKEAYNTSVPERLHLGMWHVPLIPDVHELINSGFSMNEICRISVGRCARVSYLTHDGKRDPRADIELCSKLQSSGHMSPFEHVARPLTQDDIVQRGLTSYRPFVGNFCGWVQFRKLIPNEDNFKKAREDNR